MAITHLNEDVLNKLKLKFGDVFDELFRCCKIIPVHIIDHLVDRLPQSLLSVLFNKLSKTVALVRFVGYNITIGIDGIRIVINYGIDMGLSALEMLSKGLSERKSLACSKSQTTS